MSREVMYAVLAVFLLPLVLWMATRRRERLTQPTVAPERVPEDFGQAVEIYRQNYVEYKTTGRAEFKTAYESAQAWIEKYLQTMEKQLTDGRQSITTFVNEHAGAGTTLGELGDKMRTIKTEGPASQDAYITIKRINEDIPQDNTDLYVKAGIAAALAGVAGIMSAL